MSHTKRYLVIILLCFSAFLCLSCGKSEKGAGSDDASLSSMLTREVMARVYFLDPDKEVLTGEDRLLVLGPAEEMSLAIMKALIEGPEEEGHLPVMPRDTKLIDVRVDQGICSVDLSSEFQINHEGTELLEKLTVYAIVNSLTESGEIDKVQILIEGKQVETYKAYLALDHLLERDESLIR